MLNIWLYFSFKSSIDIYLRLKKNSKTYIKKNTKGFRNYWFYEKIHKEQSLGFWYYINIVYLFAVLIVTFVVITIGYLEFMEIPVAVLVTLLAVIESVAIGFSTICNNIQDYGTPFVLFRYASFGKPHTFITDLFAIIHPFLFVYLIIREVIGI